MQTLLQALAGLGLLVPDGSGYQNAPACRRYLVRGAPGDFGDYFRLQVAGQIYPALVHLDAGLAGTGAAFDTLGGLLAEPAQARTFIEAQHAGSRVAAQVLAGHLELAHARTLLDVGGGSGAFSIALCERNPQLRATVLDFPAVIDIARTYRQAAAARRPHRAAAPVTPCTPSGRPTRTWSCCPTCSARSARTRSTPCWARPTTACDRAGCWSCTTSCSTTTGPDRRWPPCGSCSTWPTAATRSRSPPQSWVTGCGAHGFDAPSCRPLIPDITAVLVGQEDRHDHARSPSR